MGLKLGEARSTVRPSVSGLGPRFLGGGIEHCSQNVWATKKSLTISWIYLKWYLGHWSGSREPGTETEGSEQWETQDTERICGKADSIRVPLRRGGNE